MNHFEDHAHVGLHVWKVMDRITMELRPVFILLLFSRLLVYQGFKYI